MIIDTKQNIETLAQQYTPQTIANMYKFVQDIKIKNQTTLSNTAIEKGLEVLVAVSKLQTNKSYYLFETKDSWIAASTGCGEGFSLHRRMGDSSIRIYPHSGSDWLPGQDEIIDYIKSKKIPLVYTGSFPRSGKFLDIDEEYKTKPFENETIDIISNSELQEGNIEYFKRNGINIVVLDELL